MRLSLISFFKLSFDSTAVYLATAINNTALVRLNF